MEPWCRPITFRLTVAYALWFAWVLVKDWSNLLLGATFEADLAKGASFLAVVLSLVCYSIAMRHEGRGVGEGKAVTWSGAALMALLGAVTLARLLLSPLPLAVVLASWFLGGVGEALFLVTFLRTVDSASGGVEKPIFHLSLLIGCICFIFIAWSVEFSFGPVVFMTAAPLVSALFLYPLRGEPRDEAAVPDRAAIEGMRAGRLERGRAFDLVETFLYSMVFSYGMLEFLDKANAVPLASVSIGVFSAGILVMAYNMILNQKVSLGLLKYCLLVFAALSMGSITLDASSPTSLAAIGCICLMFGFTSFDSLSVLQILALLKLGGSSSARTISSDRLSNAIGVLGGWCLFALPECWGGPGVQTQPAVSVALIMLVVFGVVTISVFRNMPADADAPRDDRAARWDRASQQIMDSCCLSPRERDVFLPFVKGRDAEFICNELCISQHTVRTHIQHIYKKTGVHSQQELISMVESMSRSEGGQSALSTDSA